MSTNRNVSLSRTAIVAGRGIGRQSVRLQRLALRALTVAAVGGLVACTDRRPEPLTSPAAAARRDVSAASTITVTNTNDAGAGSLRQAIADAADGGTIQFDPSIAGGTISLATGQLVIDKSLTIEGPVPGGMTVDGASNGRVFNIGQTTGGVTLRNLTISGGLISDAGAGIASAGHLTLDHLLIAGNQNTAGVGGGLYLQQSASDGVVIINSTITGNSAAGSGAGVYVEIGHLTLTNVTVASNTSTGVAVTGDGLVTIQSSIVAANSSGNCVGSLADLQLGGTNLSSDASCGAAGTNMIVTADPKLGSLADNGGPTRTMALLRGSPAIDAATDCTVNTDQRYVTRPQGAACDIGAYEFNDYVKLSLSIDASVTVNPTTGTAVVTGTIACPETVSLTLHVGLVQPQKAGRVATTVSAADDLALTCNGTKAWAIPLTSSSGAFQVGSGTASATTTNLPQYVLPASASASVKLYWGHKP